MFDKQAVVICRLINTVACLKRRPAVLFRASIRMGYGASLDFGQDVSVVMILAMQGQQLPVSQSSACAKCK